MQYRLHTLMMVLALGPPMLAWWVWPTLDAIINPVPSFESTLAPGDNEDLIGVPITLTLEP